MDAIKLTEFSTGGGCGCKISPEVLSELLAHTPAGNMPAQLLVGKEHADDAAVYQLNEHQALIATTDFFTPIVDDPFDFGRIAATNALSDVYAMGGTPIMALAVLGMPIGRIPSEAVGRILEGGATICQAAGAPVVGGHSIDINEPVYGLVGLGVVDPVNLKTNATAQEGDLLVLTKPLGIGILSAALKKGLLSDAGYEEMIKWTTTLNRVGTQLGALSSAHAMTDVTGFGLLGHLLEVCKASQLKADIHFKDLPFIEEALIHAQEGIATGASSRNWLSYGESISLPANIREWQHKLLTDPQTSGGLLIACSPDALPEVQEKILAVQGNQGTVIGRLNADDAGVIEVINR